MEASGEALTCRHYGKGTYNMHAMKSQEKFALFNSLLETRSRFLREFPQVSQRTAGNLASLRDNLRDAAHVHPYDDFIQSYLNSVSNLLDWYKRVTREGAEDSNG